MKIGKAKIRSHFDLKLTFGKYRGWRIADVPKEYIQWMYDNNVPKTMELADAVCLRLFNLTQGELWALEDEAEAELEHHIYGDACLYQNTPTCCFYWYSK